MINITFNDVIDNFIANATASKVSQSIIRNHLSALNIFLKHLQIEKSDNVASCTEFINLDNYPEISRQIWSLETYKSKASCLRKFHHSYLNLANQYIASNIEAVFGKRLQYYRTLNNYSIKGLCKSLNEKISVQKIKRWERCELLPAYSHLNLIKEIESCLNCEGYLLSCLNETILFGYKSAKQRQYMQTDPHKKNSSFLARHPYSLPESKFSPSLIRDIKNLKHFYTRDSIPLGLYRKEKWDQSIFDRNIKTIRRFLGFLILPADSKEAWMRGLGLSVNEISITMFADPIKLEKYRDFLCVRNQYGINITSYKKGRVNSFDIVKQENKSYQTPSFNKTVLKLAKSLLNPESGYLYQHEFLDDQLDISGIELTNYITHQPISWRSWCEQAHRELKKIGQKKCVQPCHNKKNMHSLITGMDKALILKKILPDLISTQLTLVIDQFRGDNQNIQRLIWARRKLLISFMYITPLRTDQMSKITYDPVGKNGHIYRNNGIWQFDIPQTAFKNCKYLNSDFKAIFPSWLNTIFDEYLAEYRISMIGGKISENGIPECPYVFRPVGKSLKRIANQSDLRPISTYTLSDDVMYATRLIPGCDGFRGHALRALISTGAKAIGGIKMASSVLHDSEQIAQSHYIFDDSTDCINFHVKFTDEAMRDIKNSQVSERIVPSNPQRNQNNLQSVIKEQAKQISNLNRIIENQNRILEKLNPIH
ncbi:MAG: multiprotein-bridging factor 1 family protein [Candidatus Hodarchaeota archaeon]